MSISSGYDKFKDYHQTEDGSYKLTSRWTSSNTVELNDGSTAEEKFAEIDSELNDVADNKVDKVSGKGLSTNDYTTTEKNKLAGIASGAEVNQNAFSNVKVGSTTVAADSKTDTLTLEGSNVTLTPDATNDKVTIGITKANVTAALGYTPPTKDTTYGVATSSIPGLVKSGTDITVDSSGNVSVNDDSHNHVISNVDGLQSKLDSLNSSLNNIQNEFVTKSDIADIYENSSFTLSTSGWYRIAKRETSHYNATAWIFDLLIATNYHYNNSEFHKIRFSGTYSQTDVYIIDSRINEASNVVSQARLVYDNENDWLYIDIFYNRDSPNGVFFQSYMPTNGYMYPWRLIEIERVPETSGNENVLNIYSIPSLARPVTTSNFSYSNGTLTITM